MLTTILILAVGIAPQDWYTFAPEGKNFRVELPSKPNSTSSRTVTNASGRSQLTNTQLKSPNGIYSVQVSENRGRVDPKTLDDGIRRWVADKQATLGAIKSIAVNGNPGREFEMMEQSDEGKLRSKQRWVASGNSLFMLMVAGKPGSDLPADADRFLGSLKIGGVNPANGGADAADAARGQTPGTDAAVNSTKPPFTIQLPAKPQTLNQTLPGPKGATKQTIYFCKVDGALYNAQVIAEPELVPRGAEKAALDRSKADYLRSAGAAPTDESRIETNGYLGVEFTTKAPERNGKRTVETRVRMYVMDGQFVILTAMSPPDKPLPAEADTFFRSFRPGNQAAAPGDVAMNDESKSKASPKPQAKAADRKSIAPAKITTTRIPRSAKSYPEEDLEDLSRSYLGKDREGFRDVGPAGSVLVGVRVTYIERFGGPKVRSAQPIYRLGKNLYEGQVHGEVVGQTVTFVAKPGYAVGGLVTHTGLTVDGFRMVFMKVDGDRLDSEDTYNSPWIGDQNGGSPGEVTTKGGLVVGLQGRSGNEVFALGLTALK